MKYIFLILWIIIGKGIVAQDSIRYRAIFIGDAGEMNAVQRQALQHAADHHIPGKSAVFFLGDNIYPHGMGLPGSREEETTKDILRAQYMPMRDKGMAVYFIPGNHDWDRMGPEGLAKIRRQGDWLEEQSDPLLKLVPRDGCPDPVEIALTDSLTIIAYDSEWWLFPFKKEDEQSECACKTKAETLAKMDELRYKNRHKVVLLASHHPFQTYGVHGGKFSWKDHLFPLTAANKNLYIPLPVIGSLYPLLRSVFTNPEDLGHPLYKDMIGKVSALFDSFPNMMHVAGHEHGLQFIKGRQTQIVSGAGSKNASVAKGSHSLFADAEQGYVTVDLLIGNTLRVTYYAFEDKAIRPVFVYTQPFVPVAGDTETEGVPIGADSLLVTVHPSYDKPGRMHRFFFGENYRKEWAAPTMLPVIRLSQFKGGLVPTQLGGGMQSKSLRLVDNSKQEWVIRSVEKTPDKLLPEGLRETFARDVLDDATSAQHPFSALIVPPLANAVQVPHAHPVIGILSPDKNLGHYSRTFSNLVVLLEEREPLGESENTAKLKKDLGKDNDNQFDGKAFLRARFLDMFMGDWDRHEDQWRWYDQDKGKNKNYIGVPRDRDQVFHLTQGLIPGIAARESILPTLRDYDAGLTHVKWVLFKTRFTNPYPEFQFSRKEWADQALQFKTALTDSVLEASLQRLPAASYQLRHDLLLQRMKARRERIPDAADEYYRFIQKFADIRASDKNELIEITGADNGGMTVRMSKINKDGEIKEELMNKTFDAALTREIRLYTGNGNDSISLNNPNSGIRLRIVGGKDAKVYHVVESKNRVRVYDRQNGSRYSGKASQLRLHIADDSANTAYVQTNLYNIMMPLATAGLNPDDGFILGAGFKYTKQEGFRKSPFTSRHQLMAAHSFSTSAFRIKYNGEWTDVAGKADLIIQALAKAPDNTSNFFGRGNESVFNKTGDFKKYYRTRFSVFMLDPALRWKNGKGASVNIGPSLYYYRFDTDDNIGRFINNVSLIGSYDSATVDRNKLHLGMAVDYTSDKRNNKVLPQWGSYLNIRFQAYKGVGDVAASFAQLIPEVSVYKSLNASSSIVLAERAGGTVSIGRPAFYQSAFIGGQGNLLGYRQFRFAGQHSLYNNLELRIKVSDVAGYIISGQVGITGFWDIGRVWENHDNSGKWHNGTGAGIYFAPASLLALHFVMAHSAEGWYPFFTMGLRF